MAASDYLAGELLRARVCAELASVGVDLDDLRNAGSAISLTRELDDMEAEQDALGHVNSDSPGACAPVLGVYHA